MKDSRDYTRWTTREIESDPQGYEAAKGRARK
jgi:hypothetical protein